jgi:sigma-E factor negative regulatory protein RseA
MTVEHKEMLSALVDGTLSSAEIDKAIALLSEDPQAKQQFLRYQQASDVMNGYTASGELVDISSQVSLAIAKEPSHAVSTAKHQAKLLQFPTKFWKQTAGLAVAASVGALAVVGVMTQQSVTPQGLMTPVAKVEQTASPTTQMASSSNRWTVGEPEVEDRLNNYLVDHNEYAGASGLFSYARVVSYGAGE